MKTKLIVVFYFLFAVNAFSQGRSFNEIFPNASQEIKNAVFSETGYVFSSQKSHGFFLIGSHSDCRLDPQIVNTALSKNPNYIVESILIIPAKSGSLDLLDIYNAIGEIRGLKGRLYDSFSKGPTPLFEDATRISSDKQTTPIPDPAPSKVLPQKETVFIRLKDANFGNSFYRGDMTLNRNGLCFTMTNFKNITYMFIPVMKEEKFIAQLYFELIDEGILVYSIAGADVSDLIANRIDIRSAIAKRLDVITSWATEGIMKRLR